MTKVLIAKPNYSKFSPTGYKMLLSKGYEIVEIPRDENYTLEELKEIIPDVDAVIADSESWCEEAFAAAGKLKVLARYGTGMNSVDTEAARRHNVIVTNCPGVNANAVAEHAMALILSAMRNITNLNTAMKSGSWKQSIFKELAGATVGIIGFGFIGRKLAQKLSGFECRVLAYDVKPDYEAAAACGVSFVSFEEILRSCDVISLNVPLVPETYHCINAETLAMTKKGVVFVSEARGAVVDEKAMYDALVSGQVGFLATDVFEHEPVTLENTPLLSLDNVIASPHNGGETYENSERCGTMTASQVIDALEGREPVNRRV